MDIKRLRYFCAIVEHGQISRAAKALHISQPPLSQRLKELEDEFGVPLVLRDSRRWEVTAPGRVLYERARQLLQLIDEIPAEVGNAADGEGGVVNIGVSTMCLSQVVNGAPAFCARLPRLRYALFIEDSATLLRLLGERAIDFAVLLLPVAPEPFTVRLLDPVPFAVVMPEGFAAAAGGRRRLRLEELAGLPLLLSRRFDGQGSYARIVEAFQSRGLEPNVILECADVRALLSVLEAGLQGAALVPASELPARLAPGLCARPLDEPQLRTQPAVVTLKGHYLTSAAQTLIELICASAAMAPSTADTI